LIAPQHLDAAVVPRVGGEHVDDEVEPQPRGPAADGGRAHDDRGEPGLALLGEHGLAERLVLGVVGERLERQVLADVGFLLDAVDARRRGVHEAPHAGGLGRSYERAKRVVVDRAAERGIEVVRGIVGDAGEVHDRIDAFHRAAHHRLVADIADDLDEVGPARPREHVPPVYI
jgi:hypothetical protein